MVSTQIALTMESDTTTSAITSHAPGGDLDRLRALEAYHFQNHLNDVYAYRLCLKLPLLVRCILAGAISSILLLGIIQNRFLRWRYRRIGRQTSKSSINNPWRRAETAIRKLVTLPALSGNTHVRPARFLGNLYNIPRRIDTLILLSFTILNILFCCFGFKAYKGNILYISRDNC
jgi:hypothetical protein